MKITKAQLRQIIKEELNNVVNLNEVTDKTKQTLYHFILDEFPATRDQLSGAEYLDRAINSWHKPIEDAKRKSPDGRIKLHTKTGRFGSGMHKGEPVDKIPGLHRARQIDLALDQWSYLDRLLQELPREQIAQEIQAEIDNDSTFDPYRKRRDRVPAGMDPASGARLGDPRGRRRTGRGR